MIDRKQSKKPPASATPASGDQSGGSENSEQLIRARVRPNNSYGHNPAGSVVEVSARELRAVSHALISLEDEARNEEAATKPAEPSVGQKLFRSLKKSLVKANEAQMRSRARQTKENLRNLGLEVKGKEA